MKKYNYIVIGLIILTILNACKKEESVPNADTSLPGTLNVEFINKVDNQDLDITGNTSYFNSLGEEYSVNRFKYYLSNIRLIKQDSSRYYLPETYWLMDAENPLSLMNK